MPLLLAAGFAVGLLVAIVGFMALGTYNDVVALIQRDAGGNAAEVIDQVAFNVRVRQELRRLARTMTAQGRMARWILTMLPIALFFLLVMINKQYVSPLWTTTYGIMALIISAIMVTIGSQIIKRIVDIKV